MNLADKLIASTLFALLSVGWVALLALTAGWRL